MVSKIDVPYALCCPFFFLLLALSCTHVDHILRSATESGKYHDLPSTGFVIMLQRQSLGRRRSTPLQPGEMDIKGVSDVPTGHVRKRGLFRANLKKDGLNRMKKLCQNICLRQGVAAAEIPGRTINIASRLVAPFRVTIVSCSSLVPRCILLVLES